MKLNACFLVVFSFALIFFSVANQSGENAGVKSEINNRGLDLIKQLVLKFLEEKISEDSIPNFSGSSGSIQYSVSNVRVNSFNLGRTTFSVSAPNIFSASTSGAALSVSADWRASYRLRVAFFRKTFRFSGSITTSASGVSISHSVAIGRDNLDRPTFYPHSCAASIGSFSAEVSNTKLRILINLLIRIFRNKVRNEIAEQICPLAERAIRDAGRDLTEDFDGNFPFVLNTVINLGMVCAPEATSSSIMVFARGRCLPRDNLNLSFNFTAPPLPSFSSTNKMAKISVGDYVLNTLLTTFWQTGVFSRLIELEEVADLLGFDPMLLLQDGSLDFGDVGLSTVAQDLENSTIQIRIVTPTPPSGTINNEGITVRGEIVSIVELVLEGGVTVEALSLTVAFNGTALVLANSTSIYGDVTELGVEIVSAVGIPDDFLEPLNLLLAEVVEPLFRPIVDGVTESGLEIPSFYGFQVVDPTIEYKEGALEIAADFRQEN